MGWQTAKEWFGWAFGGLGRTGGDEVMAVGEDLAHASERGAVDEVAKNSKDARVLEDCELCASFGLCWEPR